MATENNDANFDLVVIGSGPAGQKAAICGAKARQKVLIVEAEGRVGGACVHRGTIPSKTLRETAVAFGAFQRRTGGVMEVAFPQDMQVASLMTRLSEVVLAHEGYMAEQLRRNGVAHWHGRAGFISANEVEVRGIDGKVRRAAARFVVVAVGSKPRSPEDINVDHENILDSDSILSMTYLPQSLTVLGAGVIASEYASIFAALGVKVTMIDGGKRPVGFMDSELTDRFLHAFGKVGGRFIGEQKPRSCVFDGVNQVVTTLTSGEVVTSEKVLFALGRVACLDGLNIGAAGLTATGRGILAVNENYQTAVPNIYAVGDVIGPPSLASSSMDQGRRAVSHALGLNLTTPPSMIPLGVYSIPEMSSVGLSEAEAQKQLGGAMVGRARFDEVARGQIAGIEDGVLKLVADPAGRKLLGIQIVGEGACELVATGQMALLAGLDVDVFVDNIFNFPTLAEAYRVAAMDIVMRRPV
jgi:NAD(P) transhydrogenase